MNTNIMTDLRLNRQELIQLTIVLSNRLEAVQTHIRDTDYEAKYAVLGNSAYAEKVKHDDQIYAHDLQIILAKLAHALG